MSTIIEYSDNIQQWAESPRKSTLPLPPDWVERLPLAGPKIAATWTEYATQTPEALAAKLGPYIGQGLRWLAAEAGGIGLLVVQFLLTIVIAAVMYSGGIPPLPACASSAPGSRASAARMPCCSPSRAIRGVALGVVVTALVQALLGGIGLAIAGVPFAGVLTAAMLLLCLAQIGPTLVLVPATIWMYWTGDNVWGTCCSSGPCSWARSTIFCGRC